MNRAVRSIRLRIGVSVFGVVLVLLVAQAVFVLDRVRSSAWEQVDADLAEEIAESLPLVGSGRLQSHIDTETRGRTKWNELFFEVRDARGALLAASDNLPAEGIPGPDTATTRDGIGFWESAHPLSRSGHRHIRIAESRVGDVRIRVARTLKRQQKVYWVLRRQLATGLLVIALLGAGVAWVVAARVLRPVRLISDQAQKLGTVGQGTLPRSGSGDELDELAGVLNELLVRIQNEVGRIRRMTADVGHALRTPLTAIRGTLELILARSSGETSLHLEGAVEEVDRMTRMINDLLLLEKVESGVVQAGGTGPVELDKVVASLLEFLTVLADERGIRIDVALDAATVTGSAAQLRQAFANLLENALRHTPDGGRIGVYLACSQGTVELVVEDSGPGVPEQDVERVFERFYSTAGDAGTGLGLAIARAVALAHGGTAFVRPGPGGVLVFSIPAS